MGVSKDFALASQYPVLWDLSAPRLFISTCNLTPISDIFNENPFETPDEN